MSTNKRKHVCHTCHKSFTRSATLRDHKRSHEGKRPFGCSICVKSFTRKYDRTMHEQQVHHHLAPYHCRQRYESGGWYGCGTAFKRKHDLERHLNRKAAGLCRALAWDQDTSSPSSISIVICHSGLTDDVENIEQDDMDIKVPYRSPSTELSLPARAASSQSQSNMAEASDNNAIQNLRPSTYLLHDWRMIVLKLSRVTVTFAKALQCAQLSPHTSDLRLNRPLLQCHQDLNRGAQALIQHRDYGPLRLCVNALFIIAAGQQDVNQVRIHTRIISWLYEQYNRHPPPIGPSIGMWSFGGQHYLPLDHVQNWRSGNLSTRSAIQSLGVDNSWFELESSWLSSGMGRNLHLC